MDMSVARKTVQETEYAGSDNSSLRNVSVCFNKKEMAAARERFQTDVSRYKALAGLNTNSPINEQNLPSSSRLPLC